MFEGRSIPVEIEFPEDRLNRARNRRRTVPAPIPASKLLPDVPDTSARAQNVMPPGLRLLQEVVRRTFPFAPSTDPHCPQSIGAL